MGFYIIGIFGTGRIYTVIIFSDIIFFRILRHAYFNRKKKSFIIGDREPAQ